MSQVNMRILLTSYHDRVIIYISRGECLNGKGCLPCFYKMNFAVREIASCVFCRKIDD